MKDSKFDWKLYFLLTVILTFMLVRDCVLISDVPNQLCHPGNVDQ